MDLEHHLELHLLANGIDANTNRLEKLELKGASIPEHIIICRRIFAHVRAEQIVKPQLIVKVKPIFFYSSRPVPGG